MTVLAVAAVPFVLWGTGFALTLHASRATPAPGGPRQYLAATLHGVQITATLAYEHEMLVTVAVGPGPSGNLVSGTYLVETGTPARCRVERWRDDATVLRAYIGRDGGFMLLDPRLGGCVACEPAVAVG